MRKANLGSNNLLSISELGSQGLKHLLFLTASFDGKFLPEAQNALLGKTVATLFWESSTRTKLSFEAATKQLAGQCLNLDKQGSAASKGESIRDTVETLLSLRTDCLVVRHSSSGAPSQIARWVDVPVINAGDGCNAHPTQALLDCYTIQSHLGDLAGLRILIVGDIRHSRVARSCIVAFKMLGANVSVFAPPTLLPVALESWGVELVQDYNTALERTDVVYLLRVQKERQDEAFLPSLKEYNRFYGLTMARAKFLKDHALIMHPGPINRGVEIDNEVAELENAVLTEQVANGVLVRMAVLYHLLAEEN